MPESLAAGLKDGLSLFGVAMFLGLAVLETVRPARPATGSLVSRWTANIGLKVVNVVTVSWLFTDGRIIGLPGVREPTINGPAAMLGHFAGEGWVLLCGVLIIELFLYAAHRLEHSVFALWRMHVVHHSDSELDTSTGFRRFPVEYVLNMALGVVVFIALGLPGWVGVAYGVIGYAVGMTQHANVRLLPPSVDRALQWVLVTPDMHRVHHSVRRAEHDSNYGNVLSIWDHLFGTYRALSVEEHAAMTFGIAEFRDSAEARPDRVLLQPFRLPHATRTATTQALRANE